MELGGQLLNPLENSPWYPLDRRLDGPHSWYGCYGEENFILYIKHLGAYYKYHIVGRIHQNVYPYFNRQEFCSNMRVCNLLLCLIYNCY
jgi:hypothetical protein